MRYAGKDWKLSMPDRDYAAELAHLVSLSPLERKRHFYSKYLQDERNWLGYMVADIQTSERGQAEYTLENIREQRKRVQWAMKRLKSLPSPNIK